MENITYSYAASLKKRIACWQHHYPATDNLQNFRKLKERKSLLTEEDYRKLLRLNDMDEAQLDIGLSSFDEEKAALLMREIEEEAWFSLHQRVFAVEKDQTILTLDLQTAIRFHADYYKRQISSYLKKYTGQLEVSSSAIADSVVQLQEELFFLARKTLVWDVHQVVEQWQDMGLTKEAEFEKYIVEYLGSRDSVYNFFSAYPVLARLLASRLQFACDNFIEFIEGILLSKEQLSKQFFVEQPFSIDRVRIGKGDSHAKGKSVIDFRLNSREFMFKFKNLEIGQRFNQMLYRIEEWLPVADFYKIDRIVESTYSIEEKVLYTSCIDEQEVEQFYSRYGQLLALSYWLGATDLHMENIIAHGSYPVLVDVETLIRPEFLAEKKTGTIQQSVEKNSVLATGLVPRKDSQNQVVAIDALSGQKQKLPYQVSQLRQTNSSDICFELADGYMEGAQNVPILGEVDVDYMNYREFIVSGFQSMNEALLAHKEELLQLVEELFADVSVRVILRDTQSYSDYLMYAAHPECMSNYTERERVIDNLWRTEIVPDELILEEIDAMAVNDIPLFVINSSEKTILAADKMIHIAAKSPLEATYQRIQEIDKNAVQLSLLLLKESLQLLSCEPQTYPIVPINDRFDSAGLTRTVEIGDMVIENLLWNEEKEQLFGVKVTLTQERKPILSYTDENLYDGLGGIYLFLLTLNHFAPKQVYREKLSQLEQQIFKRKNSSVVQGIFTGLGMKILLDFFAAELLQEKKHKERLFESLHELSNKPLSNNDEWLDGSASLYTLLSEIYKVYPHPIIKKLLFEYAQDFVVPKELDCSFAHGYAGILYSLEKINEILMDHELAQKIGHCRFILLNNCRNEDVRNLSWCRGVSGLQAVLTEEDQTMRLSSPTIVKKEDCLCHGQSGNLSGKELLNSSLLKEDVVHLTSDEAYLPIDLFTGISGIGYQLLHSIYESDVRSILFLHNIETI